MRTKDGAKKRQLYRTHRIRATRLILILKAHSRTGISCDAMIQHKAWLRNNGRQFVKHPIWSSRYLGEMVRPVRQ